MVFGGATITQAGTLLGMVMVGLLAQWPFLAQRPSKHDEPPSSALAAPSNEVWERVRTYPGVKGSTGNRYEHALGLVPD